MNVRIERKRPFFTSGQRSENNPWSCFPVTSHRGCDQYVCYPRPGQLINRSQLLCWKTSYHHIRAVYLLWSISTKDLHLSAFGCPEDQFRERHWRISKHQLPYSKTINPCTYPQNMDLKEKKYRSNLVSFALNLRRTVWEGERRPCYAWQPWHLTTADFFRTAVIAAPKFRVTWAHIHDLLLLTRHLNSLHVPSFSSLPSPSFYFPFTFFLPRVPIKMSAKPFLLKCNSSDCVQFTQLCTMHIFKMMDLAMFNSVFAPF